MTRKEVNNKVVKLFNRWNRDFRNNSETPSDEYYDRLSTFKAECFDIHHIVGVYGQLTDKNALKMASICGSVRFVEPYQMLYKLQIVTNTY